MPGGERWTTSPASRCSPRVLASRWSNWCTWTGITGRSSRGPTSRRDFRRLAGLLAQPLAALNGSNYREPVWHCAVRAAPEDRLLSDAEWAQAATAIMDRTGLAPVGDDLAVRWVAVRHAPDHIHLVATLARQDQIRPKVWNDHFRVREACRDVERRFGLRSTAPADRTAARRPTRAESERAIRRGWDEPPRARLRREVCTAAAGARSEQDFFTRLAQAGVLVRHRYSTASPGQITGYAAGLPEHTGKDGRPIWYGGGKLAADLTLPKLRTRWSGPQARDPFAGADQLSRAAFRAVLRATVAEAAEHAAEETGFFTRLRLSGVLVRERFSEVNPGEVTGYAVTLPGCTGQDGMPRWFGGGRLHGALTLPRLRESWARAHGAAERSRASRFTGPERTKIYRHAARQAAIATEHLRRSTATDPERGGDAAWAVADALRAVAGATGSQALRCAADTYDRASRSPYGRIARRTPVGNQLRAVARLLAMTGGTTGDGMGQAGALAASLVALIDAVAGLRQAQAHAVQAAAARRATEQLHSALTAARIRVTHPGQNPARSARHAAAAAEFPLPLADVLAAAVSTDSAEQQSKPQMAQPPARARPTR